MATQVRLFVSAGPAEEGAREHLGRALAELPVNVGWVIKRTPDVDSVAECHLFALLLGHDIVAPVGLELWWARRTEKLVLAYTARGLCVRQPARCFIRRTSTSAGAPSRIWWRCVASLLLDISHFLLGHVERYGVTIPEAEALRGFTDPVGEAGDARAWPAAAPTGRWRRRRGRGVAA